MKIQTSSVRAEWIWRHLKDKRVGTSVGCDLSFFTGLCISLIIIVSASSAGC